MAKHINLPVFGSIQQKGYPLKARHVSVGHVR
jgi:hypothetical protein